MLNCTIYALIFTTALGFACFDSVCRFLLCESSYVNRMKILRPYGSKKTAKDAQRHLIQSNRGQNHGLGRSRRSSKWIIVRTGMSKATMIRPWRHNTSCGLYHNLWAWWPLVRLCYLVCLTASSWILMEHDIGHGMSMLGVFRPLLLPSWSTRP